MNDLATYHATTVIVGQLSCVMHAFVPSFVTLLSFAIILLQTYGQRPFGSTAESFTTTHCRSDIRLVLIIVTVQGSCEGTAGFSEFLNTMSRLPLHSHTRTHFLLFGSS